MYNILHLSPMIPSYQIEETASFFQNVLGFEKEWSSPEYAVLFRGNFSVHLLRAGTDIGQMEFYLQVDDVDALWESIQGKLDGVKFKAPFDQEYGMREFHIGIPHTQTLLFVGQELGEQ